MTLQELDKLTTTELIKKSDKYRSELDDIDEEIWHRNHEPIKKL